MRVDKEDVAIKKRIPSRKGTRVVYTFALFIIVSCVLAGADVHVRVTEDGTPLPDVTVGLFRNDEFIDEMDANDEGRVHFLDVPKGKYRVIALLSGYGKREKAFEVKDETVTLEIPMIRTVIDMDEIVIITKRNKGSVTTRLTLEREDLRLSPTFVFRDAFIALQTLPGIISPSDVYAARPSVQAGTVLDRAFYLDDVRFPLTHAFTTGVTHVSAFALDRIDVYTAAYPLAITGDGASAIHATTPSVKDAGWHGMLSLSSTLAEAYITATFGSNIFSAFTARRALVDLYNGAFASTIGETRFPVFYDASLSLSVALGMRDTIRGFLFFGRDSVTRDVGEGIGISSHTFFSAQTNHNGMWHEKGNTLFSYVRYEHRFNGKDYLEAHVSYAMTGEETASNITGDTTETSFATWMRHEWNAAAHFYVNSLDIDMFAKRNPILDKLKFGLKLAMGGSARVVFLKGAITNARESVYDGTYTNDTLAFATEGTPLFHGTWYVQGDVQLRSFILQGGVRHDYTSLTDEHFLTIRGGVKYEANDSVDFFVKGGMYRVVPMVAELLPVRAANTSLTAEKETHAVAGLDIANKDFSIRIEGFFKYGYDLFASDSALILNNEGERRIFGGNILLYKKRRKNDWFHGWLSYTYATGAEQVASRTAGDYFASMPPESVWYTPQPLRQQTLAITMELTFLKIWKTALSFTLANGTSYTVATNVIRYEIPSVGTRYELLYDEFHKETLPPIHSMNITVRFPYSLFSLIPLVGGRAFTNETFIEIYNVYNAGNVVGISYGVNNATRQGEATNVTAYSEEVLGASALTTYETKGLPFSLVIGMRMRF